MICVGNNGVSRFSFRQRNFLPSRLVGRTQKSSPDQNCVAKDDNADNDPQQPITVAQHCVLLSEGVNKIRARLDCKQFGLNVFVPKSGFSSHPQNF